MTPRVCRSFPRTGQPTQAARRLPPGGPPSTTTRMKLPQFLALEKRGRRADRLALAGVALMTLVTGCAAAERRVLIEASELPARLSAAPPPTLLDARKAEAYVAGHVAGAVHVDADAWRQESLSSEHGLEDDAIWRGRIGAAGIDAATEVVVYDDGRMLDAARVWFILQLAGVERAVVLNGGWKALQGLISDGAMKTSTAAPRIDPKPFKAPPATQPAVAYRSRAQTRAHVTQKDAQIWDARTPAEHRGAQMNKNPRGGHLPGAVNLPHAELLNDLGCVRSPAEVRALLEKAGFKPSQPIVVHCESGGRSSLAALAALHAGYGNIANYYRSFSDWARDDSCPLEGGGSATQPAGGK